MIAKAELLRRLKDVMVAEEHTMPVYLSHLAKTLPWYGLPRDAEDIVAQVLEKMQVESEEGRKATSDTYRYIAALNP